MNSSPKLPRTLWERIWRGLLGRARDPLDPELSHKLSLVAFLAWVGLGVDGLTSSAYGPDEAFRTLGQYGYLAVFLALATALTVLIISYTYSRVIEHFPHGGGGYVVATQLLGKRAGVISGSALLVDYVLTITVSIASGGDAIFSLLPLHYQPLKVPIELTAIVFLVVMNLRGLKESVTTIVPIFLLFVITHFILIFGGMVFHFADFSVIAAETHQKLQTGVSQIGKWGLFLIFLKAYSMGGGTYTGIEAVSNGLGTLREPRIETGKRTMAYLAISLALCAGGLLVCYMLFHVKPEEGKTLNAVLVNAFAGSWKVFGLPVGYWFVFVTLFSESILLLVAAQTGFIDGPRVMANMAVDSWLPRRFASLSDRLTMQNGILLMGAAAFVLLLLTRGRISVLVVMYSINVFVTFSLTQISMSRMWFTARKTEPAWKRNLWIHVIGFIMCFAILCVMIIEKFLEGAWLTLVITIFLVAICMVIKRHYRQIGQRIRHIEHGLKELAQLQEATSEQRRKIPEFDPSKPTAGILVGGYSRLGRRSLLEALKFFPGAFNNIVFLSVGVINSEFFKKGETESLSQRTEETLKHYVALANKLGLPAKYAFRLGTDVVYEVSELCFEVSKNYPQIVFFAGELIFDKPNWWDKILHNETAYAIQRKIRHAGLSMVIMPLVLQTVEQDQSLDRLAKV